MLPMAHFGRLHDGPAASLFTSDHLLPVYAPSGQGGGPSRPPKRQSKGKSCMGCYQAKQRCRGYPCSRCNEKGVQCVPQSTAAIASYKRQKDHEVRKHSSSSGHSADKDGKITPSSFGLKMGTGFDLPAPSVTTQSQSFPSSSVGYLPHIQDTSPFGLGQSLGEYPVPLAFPFGSHHTQNSSPSTVSSGTEDKAALFGATAQTGRGDFKVPSRGHTGTNGIPLSGGSANGNGGRIPMAMLDNVETKPVSRIHSASLEKDDVDALVPMINDYEPFCDTLAWHRAHWKATGSNLSSVPTGTGQNMYSLPYEASHPRPDLHSLVNNIKFREEMKATFLAKSSQIMLRKMPASTFDAITRTESGAWSAAVAMVAYPWNPLWAKLHTGSERQQLFKLLEREAMSRHQQIKTRPNTWLEALAAGSLIITALFELGKYQKASRYAIAWFLTCGLYSNAVQFGLHRKGVGPSLKGPIGKAVFVGPRDMRHGSLRQDDGFFLLGNDIWWNIVRLAVCASIGMDNTDNPVNLDKIWTPWPSSVGVYLPPPCKFYESSTMAPPINLPTEDFDSQTIRLKLQLLMVFSEIVALTHHPSSSDSPSDPLHAIPLTQPGDPVKHSKLVDCHTAIADEVKRNFDPMSRSGAMVPALYDLWILLGITEIYLWLSEDSEHRNDRTVTACLKISGLLSSLCAGHSGLVPELDALTCSTIHVVRTACRQETMRYERLRVPKDALYELLIIEVSHVDQIMSQVGVTSPMASNTFAWYQASGISHFASEAASASYQSEWNSQHGPTSEQVAPEMHLGTEGQVFH